MLLKLFVLPMLLKMLDATRKPLLCATFYAAIMFTNSLMFDMVTSGWRPVLLVLAGTWGLAAAVFSALFAFDSTPLYWPAFVAGLLALLVFF